MLKKVANQSFNEPVRRFYGFGPRDEESLKDELAYIELKKKYDAQIANRNEEVRRLVKDIEGRYKIKLLLHYGSDDAYIRYVRNLKWPVDDRKNRITSGVKEILEILGEVTN